MHSWLLTLSILVTQSLGFANNIDTILQEQKSRLISERIQDYWHSPMYMGLQYTSQVWLVSHWLDMVNPQWDRAHFKKLLLSAQLPDGSWSILNDSGKSEGDIDPTVLNYWALKSMGVPTSSLPMLKARAWVLKKGGAEKVHRYTQVFLMVFGNQPWSDFPTLVDIPFIDEAELINPQVARWVVPHVRPMIYLKGRNIVRDLGPNFKVGELYLRDRSLNLQKVGSLII